MAPAETKAKSIETALIHSGLPKVLGSAVMPIFQSATYGYSGDGNEELIGYTRPADSPNHFVRTFTTLICIDAWVQCVRGTHGYW